MAFVNHEYTALNGPFSAGYVRVTRPVRDFTSKLSDIDGIFLEGQSTGANLNGEMAIGFAANGGGSSAIGFGRGHGWDTYLRFYTNTYSNAGSYNMMERMVITSDGNVGIGTSAPGTNKLAVDGTIAARKVKVTLANPWPDYVFAKGYELPSIASVEKFIREHQHLPGIPSAEEVKKME
ncbi:hypothetical protein MKQ70_07320 [Chitinophaga sedimenti]|uniref:hypothetical protein n=1 Tax=Chitinophaga sedimenti TaxID=2033606 RepID=UPI0020069540|nr:hypothetical protein [Chitinophaga sedimenti]MCK7554823.1 hypothetical protein [Chitinophaga sedimenti]